MITIGNETREIKAKVLDIKYSNETGVGYVKGVYFYIITVDGVDQEVIINKFINPLSTNPITSSKMTTLLNEAVSANPIP